MEKALLIAFCLLNGLTAAEAQSAKRKGNAQEIIDPIEMQPAFPGGDSALLKFIVKYLKYPSGEIDAQGKVIIDFIVQADCSLTDFKVIRSLHPAYDKEALLMLQKMPKWKPKLQNGKPIACGYTMPLVFRKPED